MQKISSLTWKIDQEQRKLAEDLIFNSHPNALAELITFFEGVKSVSDASSKRIEVDPSWEASKRCYFRIVHRLKDGIESDVIDSIEDRIHANLTASKNIEVNSYMKKKVILEAPKQLVLRSSCADSK